MELTLNTYHLYELGSYLSKFLHDNGITKDSELIIKVDREGLRKIDEDLYYRNSKGGEFIPSEGEIHITFRTS